jgi:ribosomal-protein-alanine N-acetyltransferase
MIIQQLYEKDVPQLVLIEEAAYTAPWSEETFKRCFSLGYHLWGLEYADHLVGYIVYAIQVGECHILNLCVHPEHQKQGFGRQLMLHVLTLAKKNGAGIAFLEVRRSNIQAISLYKKMGFIQVAERKGYYPHENGREDAIIFAKDLGVV